MSDKTKLLIEGRLIPNNDQFNDTRVSLAFYNDRSHARDSNRFILKQHPNATNSSETSVGGVSGACGSSGMPGTGDAGCSSSRGGSSSGAGGGAGTTGQGCEQVPSSHSTRESHAKFRHGLLQLMIHTIDPLHDGQSRAVIYLLIYVSSIFDLNEITIKLTGSLSNGH
ncbi:sodium/potassium/calcium exchanger Nckx30C isoform X7 [Vespula maculifrons]|uniref:Sodium/potassium/calcium exchanger Nckx30C isoform X7 n=1 Tax=Vespula maculifrons TaxID=7453 RepID=A0ABD2BI58_VESMC